MAEMDAVLVIPAYNAAGTLGEVLKAVCSRFKKVIVVNDGSADETGEVARSFPVTVLSHERNCGKGVALKTGFRAALETATDAVVTMDADGQHDPRDLNALLEHYYDSRNRTETDAGMEIGIVIGSRFSKREQIPSYRYYPNRVGQWFVSVLTGQEMEDTQSGYRVYNPNMLRKVHLRTERFELETEVIICAAKCGYRISFVPIEVIYPENEFEKTNFKPVTDTCRISVMVLKEIFSSLIQRVK